MDGAPAAQTSDAGRLDLIGGELCLDFTNTVGNHRSENPREHLETYLDLVAWSEHAGILAHKMAKKLTDQAAQQPAHANAVFQRALALREALYCIFSAISEGRTPKSDDVHVLNHSLAQAMAHARLAFTGGSPARPAHYFKWDWEHSTNDLDQMLWDVARSAADLLTSDRLILVRECAGDVCGWLFVDTSKNHSRRWCSMSDCGNRAKVQRYYGRRRGRDG